MDDTNKFKELKSTPSTSRKRVSRLPIEQQLSESCDVVRDASTSLKSKILEDEKIVLGAKGVGTGRTSNAQVALLNKYKIDKKSEMIENTIDEIVVQYINEIQEAVSNMIEYKDSKIFRWLPKEVDEKIRTYGLYAQEYFGNKLKELENIHVFVVPVSYRQCSSCGSFKHIKEYMMTKSSMYNGYMPICKECLNALFSSSLREYKDIREVLIMISQKIDTIVYEPILTKFVDYYNTPEGKEQVIKNNFIGNYFGEVYLYLDGFEMKPEECCFSKSNLNGIPFKRIAQTFEMPQIYDDVLLDKELEDSDGESEYSYNKIKTLKAKWGDHTVSELSFLEKGYIDWCNGFEISGKNQEILVKQMCLEELQVNLGRSKDIDVSKQLKNLQEMMKTSNLNPKKTDAITAGKYRSFGELIKIREREGPIINKDKDFEDIDGIRKIWRSMMGAISRTIGKRNKYVEEFEENYGKYTVGSLDNGGKNHE